MFSTAQNHSQSLNFLTADTLRGLVDKGDFEEARRVRRQLASEGLAIPTHATYLRGVHHALQTMSSVDDETISEVEEWLQLYPDAQYFHHHPFRAQFAMINATKSKELLYVFGRVCAVKGYHWLVVNKVIPALSGYYGTEELRKELEDLVQRSQDGSSHAEQLKAFREKRDTMDDMTLFSHIQQTLPKTLPDFASEESLVFEETSEETDYLLVSSEIPVRDQQPSAVLRYLEELIFQGQYHSAKRILTEALDLDMSIPPSRAFLNAAAYVLGSPLNDHGERLDFSNHERLHELTLWLSHIPIHKPNAPDRLDLDDILHLLFQPVIPNLNLIKRFGLVASSRGYASVIASRVIPFVMQFARTQESLEFLRELEKANNEYYHTYREDQEYGLRKNSSHIRGMAVRQLARARRFNEAMSLIPTEADGFVLSAYTHQFLLARLSMAGKSMSNKAEQLQRLHDSRDWDVAGTTMRRQTLAWMYAERPPELESGMMPHTLRAIVTGLRGSTNMPHPMTIMHFLDLYLIEGRSSVIPVLRRIAFRNGYRAASTFIGAELMYSYHRGFHINVVKKFVENFYLTGVPRVEVIRVLKEMTNFERLPPASEELVQGPGERPRSAYDNDNDLASGGELGKIFPSPIQCALVFHSLVALTTNPNRREQLYQQLVALSKGEVDDQLPYIYPAYEGLSPLVPPRSFIAKVSSTAFVPFIRPLMRDSGLDRGPQIIADLVAAGLKPTIVHLTELAGTYARAGQKEKAMYILDKMEQQLEPLEASSESSEIDISPLEYDVAVPRDVPTPIPSKRMPKRTAESKSVGDGTLPPPDFVLYVSLMRGFLISKDFEAVADVNRRLRKRFKVEKGENSHLDAVIEDWAVLLRMQLSGNTTGFYKSRRKDKYSRSVNLEDV